MKIGTVLGASVSLLLAACVTFPRTPQPNIYVMRHLQAGTGSDPALTEDGARQAQLLADWFAADPPSAIYASTTRRAQETAAPLAQRLGITPSLYNPADTPALVRSLLAEPATVLIVGHSNTVPDIVEQLGGARPADIPHSAHGDIWHVTGAERRVEKRSLSRSPD